MNVVVEAQRVARARASGVRRVHRASSRFLTDSSKRQRPTSDGRRKGARARLGGRERRGRETYLSTGMVKVGCTGAAIVAFRTSAAGSGACQKVTCDGFKKRAFW